MRSIALICAFVTAVIALALGFNLIDLGRGTAIQTQYGIAWLSWSFALFLASHLIGDKP